MSATDTCSALSQPPTTSTRDYGIPKAVVNLPKLRTKMQEMADRCLNVQQDILETFVDRGQLQQLCAPTVLPNGKRIPGLKLDHSRQLAVMQALVCFCHIAAASTFSTKELHAQAAKALDVSTTDDTLASLRYDLSKLRAKGLVDVKAPPKPRTIPRALDYDTIRTTFNRMEPSATKAFLMIVAFCGFRPEEIRRTETWMVHLNAEMPHVIRNTAKGGDVTVVPLSEESVLAWADVHRARRL